MHLNPQLREDLKRLTRLVATIADAYTVALLLPTPDQGSKLGTTKGGGTSSRNSHHGSISPVVRQDTMVTPHSPARDNAVTAGTIELRNVIAASEQQPNPLPSFKSIDLVVAHSHSPVLVKECRIQVGHGLLGWVAESGRSIHIAPFEMDSSTLGIYSEAEALRSLVAVPVSISFDSSEPRHHHGVLVCDSKKSFSFTKGELRAIEELGMEVSRLLYWALGKREESSVESSWEEFSYRCNQLGEAIGFNSIEILRVSLDGFYSLEHRAGMSTALQQSEQFLRLIHQALPPHFPVVRIANGDILIAVDNMMGAFFQNKVRSLAASISNEDAPFSVGIQVCQSRSTRQQTFSLDAILRESAAVLINNSTKVVGGARA